MRPAKLESKSAPRLPIAQIIVKNGKAKGVVLANGDEIYADIISSSVDPRLTFTKFHRGAARCRRNFWKT